MPSDFYKTLGVERGATDDEIKKAYRKQALKWHPDKNPNNKEEAEKRFKEVAHAYEVLSKKETKDLYDRYGEEGLKQGRGAGGGGGRGHAPDFDFGFHDPFDIFKNFFGSNDPFETFAHVDPFDHLGYQRNSRSRGHGGFNTGFGGFGGFDSFGGGPFGGDDFFSRSSFAFSTGPGMHVAPGISMTKTSTRTSFINGKKVTTKTIVKDGKETTQVYEDGNLKSSNVRNMAPGEVTDGSSDTHSVSISMTTSSERPPPRHASKKPYSAGKSKKRTPKHK